MHRRPSTLATLAVALSAAALSCKGGHDHASTAPGPASPAPAAAAPLPPPANAVQAEMRVLHEATRDWVTAVANNQLDVIPASIPRIHVAREATEKAVTSGAYAPPKGGPEAVQAFAAQDAAFHDELVKLLRAAKAKDLPATTKQLGVVLEGCTACHAAYRFP